METKDIPISAWFAGPKSENGEAFSRTIRGILEDNQYWRRNYFPEDGVIITSEERRRHSAWSDLFEDKLMELLAALKSDCPFQSPRYAAHMVAEQTLPSIAGYFAGMLYNPNNVSREAAPVTVLMELEVGRILSKMLGYDPESSWTHLTSGGTVANLEALWVARTVKYLPFLMRDVAEKLGLDHSVRGLDQSALLGMSPTQALSQLSDVFDTASRDNDDLVAASRTFIKAYVESGWNIARRGLAGIVRELGTEPVIVVPDTHHYSFPKHADILGIGKQGLVSVRVDKSFRMEVDVLSETLDEIESTGRHVWAVVGVVGTTEEGAVDPMHDIAALRDRRVALGLPSFWLHADAAYGGYLKTTMVPERLGLGDRRTTVTIDGKKVELELDLPDHQTCDALDGLSECDSIIVDPHKLGYVPYPSGVVSFRSNLVRPLMRQNAPYIEEEPAGPEEERKSENVGVYMLEGSKPGAAAASVWLSHATIPLDRSGHGALVKDTIRNACELAALMERWPELTSQQHHQSVRAVVLCPPESNIVCYAFRPNDNSTGLEQINDLNRKLYRAYSLPPTKRVHVYDQKFFVSRTILSPHQYASATVRSFMDRLGVDTAEYESHGLFMQRSTLMNPWYGLAKEQGREYLVGLVTELFDSAAEFLKNG
jgi:glutamate/tyrosine decarboxylase-like PLP-dependent enzyme